MKRKMLVLLMITEIMMFGITGCGRRPEAPNAGNQRIESSNMGNQTQSNGQAESAGDAGNQDNGQADAPPETGDSQQVSDNITGVEDTKIPVVYMTTDISADGLMAVYTALEAFPEGNIAVKLSTGEPGSNYLRTELIGDLVQSLGDVTIVECNTAYGGARSNTALHYQVAEDHGYTQIAKVDIMDENGSMTLPVVGGSNLTENYVGVNFSSYDYFVILSHFKGHSMAGFGGAVKNISIGIASAEGKAHIHSGGTGGNMWGGAQDAFLESMAEAGKSVADYLDLQCGAWRDSGGSTVCILLFMWGWGRYVHPVLLQG